MRSTSYMLDHLPIDIDPPPMMVMAPPEPVPVFDPPPVFVEKKITQTQKLVNEQCEKRELEIEYERHL